VLATYDPYFVFSVSVGLLLVLCVVIMLFMRDRYSVPSHPVTRRVWCASRQQRADVDFVETVVTGMVHRSVQRCSLHSPDSRCDEACRYTPVAQMHPSGAEISASAVGE